MKPSSSPTLTRNQRVKRSTQVANDIKRWIVQSHKKVGDKLPQEAALIEQLGMARSTVREALASLRTQGLIQTSTGPNGGATLTQPPYERCLEAVSNHMYFEPVDITTLYALRRAVEPELAANVATRLSDEQLDELDALVDASHPAHGGSGDWNERREADLVFHDRLADACGSPMLALFCRLLNDIIRRVIVVRNTQQGFAAFDDDVFHSHGELMEAFRARDAERARAVMSEHMERAEALAMEAETRVHRERLLMDPSV
ncbi:FadR/GntR family transcriptional regulator [Delftia tsuruhatensis]|uniref:FadR/GntR family transcriptional regulator n=1 Tax=Delftia tsuruhatensis TaxID=180282 RepID=UPI003A854720